MKRGQTHGQLPHIVKRCHAKKSLPSSNYLVHYVEEARSAGVGGEGHCAD